MGSPPHRKSDTRPKKGEKPQKRTTLLRAKGKGDLRPSSPKGRKEAATLWKGKNIKGAQHPNLNPMDRGMEKKKRGNFFPKCKNPFGELITTQG